jgi:hypothetical protein
MSKPSIGDAVTPALERERRQEIKELTVLKDNSSESIYHLIFSGAESESARKNEQ